MNLYIIFAPLILATMFDYTLTSDNRLRKAKDVKAAKQVMGCKP